MPQLILNNPRLGQRSDGGLRDDALAGLRRLVNYDLLYGGETVDLEVRKGYTRWNEVPLGEPAAQLRAFLDIQENKHLLAIYEDKWYDVMETGAHHTISDYAATAPRPYCQFGNRAFIGTDGVHADDPGMLWTTDADLATATKAYRLGIKKPPEPPSVEAHDKEGHTDTPSGTWQAEMTPTSQRKLAIGYVPALNHTVRDVYIAVRRWQTRQDLSGSWQLKIYEDTVGEPGNLVQEDAVSNWLPVANFYYSNIAADWTGSYKLFRLRGKIDLVAGTQYWLVLAGDTAYYDHWHHLPGTADFYGVVGIEGLAGTHEYGPIFYYDQPSDSWSAGLREAVFYIGGMQGSNAEDGMAYEYCYTYYAEEHGSESRPSGFARFKPAAEQGAYISGYATPTDPQVDIIRLYRRELDNIDVADEDVTDSWKHVVDVIPGYLTVDAMATDQLGAVLQTLDHYCLDDTEEDQEEEGIRTYEILPSCACMWKGRLWVGTRDRNHLSYSKVFEEDGATGMLGLESPDYFPLDNTMTIPEPGYPVNIYPASNDQLIVHMSNDTAYIIYGGDQSLNPPADFSIVPFLHSNASFGMWAGTLWSHYHVYLSRAGLYMASGVGLVKPEHLTEENQSILDLVTNANLDNSIVIAVGHELWTLFDFDNDGVLDTILILDMQRDIPTRQLLDRAFRMYQYNVGLNDMTVITSGEDFREVYAADADNNYILKLNTGNLDHETAITAWFETHDLVMPDQAMIYQIDLDGWYPDESNIPTYTWLLTDHAGNTQTGIMDKIKSNEDVRGHRSGVRLKGAVSVRAKVTQVSVQQDRLRGFVISHGGE